MSLNVELLLSIITAILAALSLVIGWKIYLVFHRREIQKTQIELVLLLIARFQESKYWIRIIERNEKITGAISLPGDSIFDISSFQGKMFKTLEGLESLPVYFSEETSDRLNIEEFINNPLLPNKIAESLKTAFKDKRTYSKLSSINGKIMFIDDSRTLDSRELDKLKEKNENNSKKKKKKNPSENYICYYSSDVNSFFAGINELKLSINKWIKSIGVKDLNIHWDD